MLLEAKERSRVARGTVKRTGEAICKTYDREIENNA